jgi:hypothetical protein
MLYNQKSVLPMELVVSANTSSTLELLRRIERLPYIIEIISVTLIDPYTQNGNTQISFRLYVDDEFSKP